MQSSQGGKLQNSSHADGKEGEQGDPAKIAEEFAKTLPAANLIAEEQQKDENANKETNIVVGIDGKEERDGIQEELLVPQQPNGSQSNQGQQGKGIQPHYIPLITQCPGTQSIEAAKEGNGQIVHIKHGP